MAEVLAGLLGLAVGSFLNVVITRLPRGESFWGGRSRCPHCGHTLPWQDNVPLVSFLRLRGRCRFCEAGISWRYPAVELAGGLLGAALWLRFPASPLLLAYVPFTFALLALSVIDLEHRLLPDAITLPGVGMGVAMALLLPELSFRQAALGALAGALLLLAVAWIYQALTGRQGLGGGDVKLLAMIGAFLGINALPLVLLVSSALGSVAGIFWALKSREGRLTRVPFGPFLAVGALVQLFCGADFLP